MFFGRSAEFADYAFGLSFPLIGSGDVVLQAVSHPPKTMAKTRGRGPLKYRCMVKFLPYDTRVSVIFCLSTVVRAGEKSRPLAAQTSERLCCPNSTFRCRGCLCGHEYHHHGPVAHCCFLAGFTYLVCSVDGLFRFVMINVGHCDEVNAIKWDPSGSLLASCSDDYTAKVRQQCSAAL